MQSRSLAIILIYLVISAILLSFIPPEQQLGGWIRLIIFHGILSMAGLYAIYAAGLLGVVYWVRRHGSLGAWSKSLGLISVAVWFVGTALSLVSMQVAWGGLMWNEPRTVAAFTMVVLGVGKEYLLRSNHAGLKNFAVANAVFAAAVLLIRQTLTFVMHPENPIGRSDSAAIRLLPMLFLGFTLIAIFEYTRSRLVYSD